MNKNQYSKYKYENNFELKYSVNPYTQQPQFLNLELKTIKPKIGSNFLNNGFNLNTGQTTITNYIYTCTQVNHFDKPITSYNTVKRVFFSIFNS